MKIYDSNHSFPLYGFGAQIHGASDDAPVSQCFAVNGNIYSPECQGIDNCVGAYLNCVDKITFKEPSHFSSIIR